MKPLVKNIIKVFLFFSIGLVLFFLVYKDFDFVFLLSEIKSLDYKWFFVMLILSIISHISRAMRWQMLLETENKKVRFSTSFLAVLNAYFANLVVPRMGEVTRCGIISKYEKIPFAKVLGTMISERVVDLIVLIIFTILAIFLSSEQFSIFLNNNPKFGNNLTVLLSWKVLLPSLLLIFALVFLFIKIIRGKFNENKIFRKISNFLNQVWNGIISLKDIKNKGLFIFHSCFIWILYFLMLYSCFFAFEAMQNFSITVALVLFVAGSFGMLAPAPNGIGAYHFMIIQILLIYGIAENQAASFALIVHGLQSILIITLGVLSFILLPVLNKD